MILERIDLGYLKNRNSIKQPNSKDNSFLFYELSLITFNHAKEWLVVAPIFIITDRKLDFELMCDSRDYAIGAALS